MAFFFRRLIWWYPTRETFIAFGAALTAILLSFCMKLVDPVSMASIILRDVGQIALVGFVLPLYFMRRTGNRFASYGLSFDRWHLFLCINAALAIGLYFLLMSTTPLPSSFTFNAATFWKGAYVMAALCFELLFFYAFLRTIFERAFGPVFAILITALAYSLHHAGFQPEFGKLFFVGVLYATVYRIGNSALLIFPFFLAVGGIHDVLIKSQAVAPIAAAELRTIGLCAFMGLAVAWALSRSRATTTSIHSESLGARLKD